MTTLVTLTIDGREISVPAGTLVVDAAKKAGIDIPVFCYHPKMEPVGMCRMCLVEIGRPMFDRASGEMLREPDGSPRIQFGPKLETACTVPVSPGMCVIGLSPKVEAARKEVVEFILTSHPLDCPVCDKGGECPLQNLTMAHGPGESRFLFDEKMHLAKQVPLGELIYLDRERCIQCGRCVRFQSEVVDDPVIGFYNRGRALEIVTYSDPGFDSVYSGNTTDICPVGALTTADFRFGARPWELRATASICPHCPVGCNLVLNIRREVKSGGGIAIKRVMPRQNEAVNEIWICDKGRFAYHFTQSAERLTQPLVRLEGELQPTTWEVALDAAAEALREAGAGMLALGSGRLANEDLFTLRSLAGGLKGQAALYSDMAGGDLVAQVGLGQGSNLGELGTGSAILVVSADLREEAPIWWLRIKQAAERGAALIIANPRPTQLERYATHVLRYAYGSEATAVLGLVNALSAKRPDLSAASLPAGQPMKAAAEALANADNLVVFYGSEGLGLEGTRALAQACANLLIVTGKAGRVNSGLVAAWPRPNDQGAWEIGLRPVDDLYASIQAAKALYILAADPVGDHPGLEEVICKPGFLVVQDLFLTETAKLADVVLPAQAFTEREGSYTSGERRVQRFYPAIPPLPETQPDFAITAAICQRLGIAAELRSVSRALAQLAEQVAAFSGLSYPALAQVHEQWPIVGRGDMYYGGTTYENTQGLGVQLASAAQRGQTASLAWPEAVTGPSVAENGLIAVPVTRLYDRGTLTWPSTLLHQRIPEACLVLNPSDVARLFKSQEAGEAVALLNGVELSVTIRSDEAVPPGIALVPRSLGLPIWAPTALEVRPVERVRA